MNRTHPPQPTPAELEILRVLWQRGPSTVREVHETLHRSEPVGYTTVLKTMQIMTDKGLVGRDETQRAHVYEPRLSEEATQSRLVGDLLERAFGGSTTKLVVRALSEERASDAELDEIRSLLDALEAGRRGEGR